ncbi:peptidoglycan-binding domain-containing protein [Streptomyces sp. B-S-A8]|uniref:Peptidoglycan-binding domain-containing protein n=1 Tax=Streptomyces solicavernae TaxID=3043614 RepID=A0ABT6RZT0_9ACTN|nr:peptidoglycan-binding domain-containing protein [Streptomyces sp. B-S-A8]MDI3389679.1 peptidoglycan-binding domain-containing protein [Streptomyces sp. B-S-A8]
MPETTETPKPPESPKPPEFPEFPDHAHVTRPARPTRRTRGSRPSRTTLLTTAAAALAVVAVTVTASGLFSAGPDQEHALPDHRTTPPAPPRTTTQAPARTHTPPESPKAAATASRSGAERPSRSGPPTRTAPAVLRAGDEGPEVRELQDRLRQRYFYAGPTHGSYDVLVEDAVARYQYAEGVEGDPQGVYGPATRRALEAETTEPSGAGQSR